MTNEQHNDYISWAFIAHGAFQLLMLIMILVVFGLILAAPVDPSGPPMEFMLVMFGIMFVFQMFFVMPSFVAAYAMRKRKSWARVAAIVAGVVSAMHVPFGTAACVYSLWFFLGENWKDVYRGGILAEGSDDQQFLTEAESRWSGYSTDEKGEVSFHHVEPPDWR